MARQGQSTDVDRYAGRKLRERRMMLGLTQEAFAELIGVTYQQAHKYEKGINRMSVGRAYRATTALGMDMNALVKGIEDGGAKTPLPSRRMLEMATLFLGLPRQIQTTLLVLARTLSRFEYE